MKRQLANYGSVICLLVGAVAALPAANAHAQGRPPATHQAVIDIGYIFKNHTRFKTSMDKMRDEVMAAENSLKAERDRINGLVEQLKGFNPGTPEFKKLEAEVAKAQGEFNVTAQLQKKDFMDREAAVYHEVFGEIEKAVAQFARDHGIAVVHRFDGDERVFHRASCRANWGMTPLHPRGLQPPGLVVELSAISGDNSATRPHPRPLSRERERGETPRYGISIQRPSLALWRTASQTFWVRRAVFMSGWKASPPSSPARKSAKLLMNVCS